MSSLKRLADFVSLLYQEICGKSISSILGLPLASKAKGTVDDWNFIWETEREPNVSCRFSLLLLDPGEIYFEDFSVFYYPMELSEEEAFKRKLKGRLKICSKSLVFDPLDSAYPILKFRFEDIIKVGKWTGSLLSRLDSKGDVIVIDTKKSISMKEGNVIGPYKYLRERSKHLFSLNFVNLLAVLPQVEQLQRASSLNPREEEMMIASIVQSRQARIAFNTSWIEDLYEKIILETTGDKVTPLVCNPGRILLTSQRLYFQPFNNVEPVPVLKVKLTNVKEIVKRRYLLRHVGLEIFTKNSQEDIYLVFETKGERDNLYNVLSSQPDVTLENDQRENMTLKWQSGAISNFDYLMYLNSEADRSLNDLTQYPVFPWVIKDYTSDKLDLSDSNTFRDLSKPIGALDETRLNQLKQRCNNMPEPKFLYGSHYSTPGFVLFYLVRVAPDHMLCLQSGRFDKPDRLFNNIESTWSNCCLGHSDYKELIPEFYASKGEFLENSRNLNLGVRQDGTRVNDVQLPPWAENAEDFVNKCRAALESQYVSENLHHWIDLIFGYKQRGEEAWKADNVFYYLTYEGAVDLDSIENPNERSSLKNQILEFGQTPKQLFKCPHPHRQALNPMSVTSEEDISLTIDSKDHDDLPEIPVMKLSLDLDTDAKVEIHKSCWMDFSRLAVESTFKMHKDCVHALGISFNGQHAFSVSQDAQLKMWSVDTGEPTRSMNLSSMALSCCAVMPGSKTVLVGSWDNSLYMYSTEFGRVVDSVRVHDDAVSGIKWKDGLLITSSWDSTAKLWSFFPDADGKKPAPPMPLGEMDHDNEVTCLDLFVEGGNAHVATGTKDGQIYIWSAELLVAILQNHLHTEAVTQLLFGPDGQRILSCGLDQQMRVIDAATGLEMYSKDVGEPIRCAAWDGQIVLAGGESGDLMVWDLVRVQCMHRVRCHSGPVRSIAVAEEEGLVITGGPDGYVSIQRPLL